MKEICLKRRSGEERTFMIRRCTKDDIESILDLQDKTLRKIGDPAIFARTSKRDFLESIERDYCLAAFCGKDLAGLTLMVANRRSERNYACYLEEPEQKYPSCVSMDLTMVSSEYRGYGLQRLFTELREQEARRLGATTALVTISPENEHSLRNLVSAGYEILCTLELYGGSPRHLLQKEL